MSGITITGRMVECGDFQGDGGKTAFVTIMLANGSHVSVTGLTHQEVREISGSFMAPLDVTLTPSPSAGCMTPAADENRRPLNQTALEMESTHTAEISALHAGLHAVAACIGPNCRVALMTAMINARKPHKEGR